MYVKKKFWAKEPSTPPQSGILVETEGYSKENEHHT